MGIYTLFRMMELLVFLCLLLSPLLLCWMLVAALTVCLLLAMLLQMYRILIRQNDANRYTQHVYACHMQFTMTVGVTIIMLHAFMVYRAKAGSPNCSVFLVWVHDLLKLFPANKRSNNESQVLSLVVGVLPTTNEYLTTLETSVWAMYSTYD